MKASSLLITALALPLLLAWGRPVQAQTGPAMTLQECLAYGRDHHPAIKASTYDEQVAVYQAKEGKAYYLPQVNATGTLDDNLKRMTTVIPAGTFSTEDVKVQFGNQYTTNLYLQVDQVIYDRSLLRGIQANEENKQLVRLQREKVGESVAYNTAIAYYNAIIQKERIRLLEENEKKLAELIRLQELKLAKGLIQPLDLKRLQVNYNNTLSQKETARLNHELAMNQLRNAMGMDVDMPLEILDSLDYAAIGTGDLGRELNVQSTYDYRIQEQSIRLREIDLERKKASAFPSLSAYGRYGAQTFSNEFFDQYENFYDYAVVGLRLNVPVFSSFKRQSQVRQGELQLASTKEQFESNRNNLELNVVNAYTALEASRNTLKVNEENFELAREVFDNTNLQYGKGFATLADLLNAEYAYKEAQNNYIASQLNYVVNRLQLEKSKGTLPNYLEQL